MKKQIPAIGTAALATALAAALSWGTHGIGARPAQAQDSVSASRAAVVTALREALKREKSAEGQILLTKVLIRVDPQNEEAAGALVRALLSDEHAGDGYAAIEGVIPLAPPALVRALLPVLNDPKQINRVRAAILLGRIDPAALR
jgi:hypothetical protein